MVKPNLSKKKLAKIPLSNECKAIVLGSILGDGSLKKHKDYANAQFKFSHSIIQNDYFDWKVSMLSEITTISSVIRQPPDGYSKNEKLLFQSCACPQLTEIWECVGRNCFSIKRNWLNHMSCLSLAIWWFDDGSLTANWRRGVFCTDSFSKESCDILANYLRVVWSVTARVGEIGNSNKFRLYLYNEETKKFLRLILPYAKTQFTVSKCLLKYKNPIYQQRWISEMREYLPSEGLVILDELERKI